MLGPAPGYIGSLRLIKSALECLAPALYKRLKSYWDMSDAHLDNFAF